ncbi:DUF2059 domain-containing protein [Bosea psychrotolerans]|uniref:DUF2059 domain-containing protein n=1 Tax=Bosea psychrotolerans TaxID=1871628 RepID=A0A2S4MCA9_9HYPH|nr:DUF2059 domain-containing protein [Bosea psychrotolerans]POR52366.1 hypothetical protein CYD53_10530 [Bosea psychrotolerans]
MIRHSLASAALGLALTLSAPVFAQTAAPAAAITPSHLQLAREAAELTGISASLESIYTEFSTRTKQLVGTTRPELKKDMDAVIDALKPEADAKRAEIMVTASEIFARKINEADLKEVVTFFKSPVGQRYNAARTSAIDEIYVVLEPWSINTSNFLFDRFTQEMRKRGHQM